VIASPHLPDTDGSFCPWLAIDSGFDPIGADID